MTDQTKWGIPEVQSKNKDRLYLATNLEVKEANIKLLSNPVHKSQIVYVDNYYLSLINNNFDYDEKELVLPLINITSDTYKIYASQYDGLYDISDFITIKIANQYYHQSYLAWFTYFIIRG